MKVNNNQYTTDKIAVTRQAVSHKTCYRKPLSFLKYRISLTQSISNRLVHQSQYLRSYKDLRFYYVSLMRANFCPHLLAEHVPYVWGNFNYKEFLLALSQHVSMYDLDHALLWRGSQTNSLFNIRSQRVKKRKKEFYYRHRVFFISGYKRLLFVWKWLSVIVRCISAKKMSRKFGLIPGFENFLLAPDSSQLVYAYKLHVYKLKLVRVL